MQVKRYIDVYSNSSVVGFSSDDMSRISDLYSAAEQNWSNSVKHILMDRNGDDGSTDISALLKEQIAEYLNFFSSVVELARSKWTEFNLNLMITGFGILVISLILQFLAVFHGDKSYAVGSWLSTGAAFTLFIVTIRACSFLSNSYILEEGKVANFLLATTGLIKLRYSVMRKTMRKEVSIIYDMSLLLLVITLKSACWIVIFSIILSAGFYVSCYGFCSQSFYRYWANKASCNFSVYE
jgi:phosphatidylinositol glycan class O